MAERWYTSDHHLFHHNIIQYGERPFANLTEMHDRLLENHNKTVRPQDSVSFLGDLTTWRGGKNQKAAFAAEIKKYNGHKRLYLGNHDHWRADFYISQCGFEKVYASWRTGEGFICSHIPLHPRSLSNATANVHGHLHQHKDYDPVIFTGNELNRDKYLPRTVPYINVCLERINYTPIHLDEILQRIKKAQVS